MKDERTNEEMLARYLLGQLPEEEQQEIEQHAFDDDDFFRQLLEVEDDLRCAYAQGTLSLAQERLFEKRFLIFADERKKLALTREMIAELRQAPVADVWSKASNRGERKTDRSLLSWIFGARTPVVRYAMSVAALLVVAGGAWLLFETAKLRNEITRLRAERATAEQQLNQRSAEERARLEQLRQLDKQLGEERDRRAQLEQELARRGEQADEQSTRPAVVALFLSPGGIRGGGQTRRLVLAPGVEQVRLRLELTGGASNSYSAVLLNADGKEVISRANLRVRRDGARRIASLTLSARLLAEDDYELKLTGVDADGQPERVASYYFTILKK